MISLCRVAAVAGAFLSCSPAAAGAEPQPSDAGARVERLAEGVYAILHDDAIREFPGGTTVWPHGNTGVVVGETGVLVVDSTFLPSRARADIALIRTLTDRPVRWLVNTHWHGDHTHGNGAYRDAFPGLQVIGARPNRSFIEINLARYPRIATRADSDDRTELARLQELLASGKNAEGQPLTAADRALAEAIVAERRRALEELAHVPVVPPEVLFDERMTLMVGARRVELRNEGRANSPADVTVYLPEERVLFTGDVVVHPVPYGWQSYPVAWIEVLRRLETLPVTAVVPGHGPVLRDHAYTRQVRELLETTVARIHPLLAAGRKEKEVIAEVGLDDLRPRFVRPGDASASIFWDASIVGALIERAYACVVGYRC